MARFLFYFFVGYAVLVAVIYVFQRHLQYYPHRQSPGTPVANGVPEMKEIRVRTDDGLELLSWFAPPKEKDGKVIVFYHGNAGHIGYRADKARHFIDRGYGIFLAGYRGYGGNPGRPTEEGLYRDARAGLRWLEEQGYRAAQMVFYGESLGAGVAVQMAVEFQPKILILEAPFSSAIEMGQEIYFYLPVALLLKDRYDNIGKIGKVTAPLLVVHGDEDRVIPLRLAKKLYDAARHPKEFITINGGGHNDLYEHHAGHIVTEWLDAQFTESAAP